MSSKHTEKCVLCGSSISKSYLRLNSPMTVDLDRFMKHVNMNNDTGCWMWTGRLTKEGYGRFRYDGFSMKAHRASWLLHRGEIPAGLLVLHNCDVRNCVNPFHLSVGTHKENMQDMFKKGRGQDVSGEKNPSVRLSSVDIKNIRRLHKLGVSAKDLAADYGVVSGHIRKIINNKTWKKP